MLHVKHRHVLMNRDLEPFRRRGLQQRFELLEVEIIRRGDALQSVTIDEIISGQRIGDIEREISHTAATGEKLQMIVVADQVTVCVTRTDLIENPVLAGFEYARRSDEEG